MTPIVDAHVHLFGRGFLPKTWYRRVAEKWAGAVWPLRDPSALDAEGGVVDETGDLLLQEMERAGIDVGVCLALDWGIEFEEPPVSIREVHRRYSELQTRSRGRFVALAGVDPRRPDAVEILGEAIVTLGLRGLKVYPPCGYYPYDPRLDPMYRKCIELNVPVVVHTAYVGFPHVGEYANPLFLGRVQAAFPDLQLVLGHAGHPFWGHEAMKIVSEHPRSFLEISNWNWDLDSSEDNVIRTLGKMRDEVGAHRILFGSDHLGGRRFSGKRGKLKRWVDFIKELPERGQRVGVKFSEEEVALILGGNACRVFRIETAMRKK